MKNDNTRKGTERIEGYVAPMGDHVLSKGVDPFVRPSRTRQKRVRKLLLILAEKYLVPRQLKFFELYFLHGRTPEQIAAFCTKGGKRIVTKNLVYRRLRRIRWILERAWAFLVEYKLHRKLRRILSPEETRAIEGWVEFQKYTWKGAPKGE